MPHWQFNRIQDRARDWMAVVLLLGIMAVPSAASAQARTPTEVFTAYRAALEKATSVAEVLPFMDAKSRTMIEGLPEKTRAGMFDLLKRFAATFTGVTVTKETINGDTAELLLTGRDPKGQVANGSVPMTKEADGWKLGTEKWSSTPK